MSILVKLAPGSVIHSQITLSRNFKSAQLHVMQHFIPAERKLLQSGLTLSVCRLLEQMLSALCMGNNECQMEVWRMCKESPSCVEGVWKAEIEEGQQKKQTGSSAKEDADSGFGGKASADKAAPKAVGPVIDYICFMKPGPCILPIGINVIVVKSC